MPQSPDAFKQQYRAKLDAVAERARLDEAARACAAWHAVHASLADEAAMVA